MSRKSIKLTGFEIQSGHNRVAQAEMLILTLPNDHEGKKTWLLNYGIGREAVELRRAKDLKFKQKRQAAESHSQQAKRQRKNNND